MGSRISVVAYQQPLRGTSPAGLAGSLKQLGFVFNHPRAWRLPSRVVLDVGAVKAGTQVYSGPPIREHGIKASHFHAIWKKGPGVNWKQAEEMLLKSAREDTVVHRRIMDLEGKRISCPCPLHSRCHVDSLITLFAKFRDELIEQPVQVAPSDRTVRQAAAWQRASWEQERRKKGMEYRQAPTQVHGTGELLIVGHAECKRLLAASPSRSARRLRFPSH